MMYPRVYGHESGANGMAHLDSNIDNVIRFGFIVCRLSLLIVGIWTCTAVVVHVTITLLVAGETKQSQHLDFLRGRSGG